MSATTTLNLTKRKAGRFSKVSFAVNETSELRKEALDDQRRKERKKAKVFESIGRYYQQVVHRHFIHLVVLFIFRL